MTSFLKHLRLTPHHVISSRFHLTPLRHKHKDDDRPIGILIHLLGSPFLFLSSCLRCHLQRITPGNEREYTARGTARGGEARSPFARIINRDHHPSDVSRVPSAPINACGRKRLLINILKVRRTERVSESGKESSRERERNGDLLYFGKSALE